MVELVTGMMELKKQQARAPKKQSPSAKQLLDQKLAITDQQIDALVYELYQDFPRFYVNLEKLSCRSLDGGAEEHNGPLPRRPRMYDIPSAIA